MARELKNILINRIHDRQLRELSRSYCRGRLVDIGCGTKPYASMLAELVDEHIGVDHPQSIHDTSSVDRFGTAYELPLDDSSADCVLCTAVLEHLEEPERALREAWRVLKPGGTAIYSVPFIWHLHEEPRDFFRFSKYGLAYLFDKSGFKILELRALSGFWVTFGQLFVYNLYRYNRGPLRLVVPLAGLLVQGASYVLDRLDKAEQWTWMYMVVASKK